MEKAASFWKHRIKTATRRLNQYGQYLNHAPGSMANATPVPPIVVEGRLRVGFVATKQIETGEEVVWAAIELRSCESEKG